MAEAPDLLVIDEETSGLFDFKSPSSDDHQPRVASIGWIFATPEGQPVKTFYGLMKPQGWELSKMVSDYIGITNEDLFRYGHNPAAVLGNLYKIVHEWPRPLLLVGHNVPFDVKGLKVEAERCALRAQHDIAVGKLPTFDTMTASTPILQLPPTAKMQKAGFTKFKSPKLEEAYEHFYGHKPLNAHNALADAMACLHVYLAIQKSGSAPAPRPAKAAAAEEELLA